MRMHKMRQKTLCTVVIFLLTPGLTYAAKPMVSNSKTDPAQSLLTDIALQPGGVLVGRVLSTQGGPSKVQKILIRKDNQLVAEVATSPNGQFMVEGLRGGIYEITASQGAGSFRAWAEGTAPPSAKQFAVLVDSDEVVRGQWGWMPYPGSNMSVGQWIGISVGVAGLVVGTIALVREPDPS